MLSIVQFIKDIILLIFIILGILWIFLFYFTPLRYIIEFLILGVMISLTIPIIIMSNHLKFTSK